MTNRAKILRAFPSHCHFCFEAKGERLMVNNPKEKALYLLNLKDNSMKEIFTNENNVNYISAFNFSSDKFHIYLCVALDIHSSWLYTVDIETNKVLKKSEVPLGTCEALYDAGDCLVMFGKRYDTHIEPDEHELIDETYCCIFTLDLLTGEQDLKEDDFAAYDAQIKALHQGGYNAHVPDDIRVYTYQNSQSEFWDDTAYYELYVGSNQQQRLERNTILNYGGAQEGFVYFGILNHKKYCLLIGYND